MKFLAVLVFIVGVILGVWLGLFVMFIGGIEQIVDGVQVDPANSSDIAWGIVRICLAGFVGWISFMICFVLSVALWETGEDARREKLYRARTSSQAPLSHRNKDWPNAWK